MSSKVSENVKELVKDKPAVKEKIMLPKKYKVFLHNDDYTPFDFVVMVLNEIFDMNLQKATNIMLKVHDQGISLVGVYTREEAETRVSETITMARQEGHPRQCTMEQE